MFKRIFAGAVLGCLIAGSSYTAHAQGVDFKAGDLLVRGRVIGVMPDVTSTISTVGGSVSIQDYYTPEVDFSYFLTDQLAVELIAATTRHGVKAVNTAVGTVNLGSVRLLPPTVTLQWHPWPKAGFSPYLGAGVNYTFFYNSKAAGGLVQSVSYKNNAAFAVQAGFDFAIAPRWVFNVDYKKVFLSTTANVNGGFVTAKVDIDPSIVGIGFGYRF